MEQAGTQQGLTQAADLWWFEHLLAMPGASEEVISHFGRLFPHRDDENASLPAPLSARLFLRHMRSHLTDITNWSEQLQLLGLMQSLSHKQHQFRQPASAAALAPSNELVTEVLLQILCGMADPGNAAGDGPAPLPASAVVQQAHELLQEADLEHLQEDELLQNRLSLLEQLLRGRLAPGQLQQHLRQAFPADATHELLREFVDKAWSALGPTSLQLHQEAVESGRQLSADPFMNFAALMPQATQAAVAAAAATDPVQSPQQQPQQQVKSLGPVALLGEATAPLLGSQELLEAQQGSPEAARQGRGSRAQQGGAAAGSPLVAASPRPAAAAAGTGAGGSPRPSAAAGAADGAAGRTRSKPRSLKEVKQEPQGAAARAGRKQLQLEPSAAAVPPAAAAAAEGQAGTDSRRARRSQKQEPAAAATAAAGPAAGDEDTPKGDGVEDEGPAAKRRRGRLPPLADTGAAAAAAAAAAAGDEEHVAQGQHLSSKPGGAAAAAEKPGKSKSIAAGFVEMLSKPLDGIAAAVSGGIAAAVGRSPSVGGGVGGVGRDRKLCGAGQAGVRGKAVAWDSPFKSSEDTEQGAAGGVEVKIERAAGAAAGKPPAAAAAAAGSRDAAAGGGRITNALKRKRGAADTAAPAAAAGGAARADSGNTEYQDARERSGSESDGAGLQQQQQQQQQQRVRGSKGRRLGRAAGGRDSGEDEDFHAEGEEEEEGIDSDSDESDEQTLQQRQQKIQQQRRAAGVGGRPGSAPAPAPAEAAGGGGGGGGPAAAAAGGGGGGGSRAAGAAAAASGAALFTWDGDDGGLKRRRKTVRWSPEEEELLVQLVAQEGEGQWSRIHKLGGTGFNHSRTQVDLKDKWRNLKRFRNL